MCPRSLAFYASALLCPLALASGCGQSDSREQSETNVYSAQVVASTDTDMKLSGMTVSYLDRATGARVAAIPDQISDSAGWVEFADEREDVAYLVHAKPPMHVDTYNIGLKTGLIRVGTVQSALLVPTLAVYMPSDDATPVAGAVYWTNPNTELDEPVGCAIVAGEGASHVSYFVGTLPTSPANRPEGTQPDRGSNLSEAGRFFVGNLAAPGMRTLKASVAGEVIGEITFPAFPRKSSAAQDLGGRPGHANLTLISIYAMSSENPTPADCR